MKRIKFYAYRDNKGATGGPGGVLYLQQHHLGKFFHDIKLKYYYKPKKKFLRKLYIKNYKGAFLYVVAKELFSFGNYYICNDIGTAFALSLLRRKYSLIYHQQGPIIEELTNFNCKFKFGEQSALRFIEKTAFMGAQSVHFPSNGAKDMYFNSSYRTCNLQDVRLGEVLPNTIEIEQGVPVSTDKNRRDLTFLSVGTLTKAKGQDRLMLFMRQFLLKCSDKQVQLIVVGKGPLMEEVLLQGQKLEEEFKNFKFVYHASLLHKEIIALNRCADIYIMLHRISIFDLATLEAMSQSCAVILSDVGGNVDFNKRDNVMLVGEGAYQQVIDRLLASDIENLKKLNKEVFDDYFSSSKFKENYERFLEGVVKHG